MASRIKFDINVVRYLSAFEKVTRLSAKDCIISDDVVIFVTKSGDLGKAIGKGASNIRTLEKMFKKKIRMVEYHTDLCTFVGKVIAPAKVKDIVESDGIVTITPEDLQSRGYIIGRNAINLRSSEDIVKRYFPIKEIKVV